MNERMARVETNIENIKEDIIEIKNLLTEHVVWENEKYDEMDKKFSAKWVEKVVIGLIVGGALAGIGVLLNHLIQ